MQRKRIRRIGMVLIWVLLSLVVSAVALCAVSLWQNGTVIVTPYTVSHEQIPPSFDGKRIVQITDLHNKDFGEQLPQLVSAQEPDVIVITGDLISRSTWDIEPAVRQVRALAAIAPTVFVPGNHEGRARDYTALVTALKDCGVTVLHDEALMWESDGACVRLIGVLPPEFGSYLPNSLKPLADGEVYDIVLLHHPDLFESAVACGADLVISGHTHGGQIRLPLIGALYAPDQGLFPYYDVGRFEKDGATMILSQGLGEEVYMRILTPPEITVITLDSPHK